MNTESGSFIFPIYLNSITSENEIISFESLNANTLKYTSQQLTNNQSNSNNNTNLNIIGKNLDNLKVKKLYRIIVKDIINSKIINYANFSFTEGANTRLLLNGIDITGNNYKFEYNTLNAGQPYLLSKENILGLNLNNINTHPTINNGEFNTILNLPQYCILTKIIYPTKGYSVFQWEKHEYGAKVNANRLTSIVNLQAEKGYVEGSRIKSITNYNYSNEILTQKKYYYVKNYSNVYNNEQSIQYLGSSGVRDGSPKLETTDYFSIGQNRYQVKFINTPYNLMFNLPSNGNRVSYSEVVELNRDNSYTKYYFTSYQANDALIEYPTNTTVDNHMDQFPQGFKVQSYQNDAYFPFTSLENERGRQEGVFHYNASNVVIHKKSSSIEMI
ncbi:MAG: hypothetical protein HC854_03155 [Flavobacterium sp.]|nr:hypothetical protein [Flavobacterium sp.]